MDRQGKEGEDNQQDERKEGEGHRTESMELRQKKISLDETEHWEAGTSSQGPGNSLEVLEGGSHMMEAVV